MRRCLPPAAPAELLVNSMFPDIPMPAVVTYKAPARNARVHDLSEKFCTSLHSIIRHVDLGYSVGSSLSYCEHYGSALDYCSGRNKDVTGCGRSVRTCSSI